jgi:hypothetical protein
MAIKDVLGFSLKPVKVDPDGFSAPPDPASLAPPSAAPDSVPADSTLRASASPESDAARSDAPLASSLAPDADESAFEPDEPPATRPRRPGPGAFLVSIPPEPLIVSAPPPPLFVSVPPQPANHFQSATGAEAAESVLASLAPPPLSERPPPVFSEPPPDPLESLPPEASSREPGAAMSLPPEAPFVSIPPEPLIVSLPPPSHSMPPALSLPPSLSPGAMREERDGSAFLSLPPGGVSEAPVSLAPGGAYVDSLASIPPDAIGAGPSFAPEHDDSPLSSEGDSADQQWSSASIDPALAEAPAHDLFATRVEGLSAPEPHAQRTADEELEAPRDSRAPAPHETDQQLLAAAGVRPRIDLRSGLLLGFAAFTSVMSAACFVVLLMRPAPTQPAATNEAAQAGEHARTESAAHADEKGQHEGSTEARKDSAHDETEKHEAAGDGHAGKGAEHEAAPAEHGAQQESAHGKSDEKAAALAEHDSKAASERGPSDEKAGAHAEHGSKEESARGAEDEPSRAAAARSVADMHGEDAKAALPLAEPARAGACRMVRPPRRLVRNVSPRVPLEARVTTDNDVLLGFVLANGGARAVKLEGSTQRVREQTSEPRMEEITGIVPLGDTHDAGFAIDHPADDELRAWRTLPGPGGFALSKSRKNQVFLLGPAGKRPSLLWSLPPGSLPTRPVVAPSGARRYAIALRDGEPTSGQVRFGWVDLAGGPPGKLETLPLGAVEVGAPSLAVRGDELMIAVALRDREEAAWRVELWRAGSKQPSRVVLPALQQGQAGDQIAPRLSALDGGRWALQWTTGKAGKRHVDLLVLDTALRAIGEPLMISGVRASGGGGLLIPNAPLLLALYLVQSSPEDYDLWLRVLDC